MASIQGFFVDKRFPPIFVYQISISDWSLTLKEDFIRQA